MTAFETFSRHRRVFPVGRSWSIGQQRQPTLSRARLTDELQFSERSSGVPAQRLGHPEIDRETEPHRLFDWKFDWSGALHNP